MILERREADVDIVDYMRGAAGFGRFWPQAALQSESHFANGRVARLP